MSLAGKVFLITGASSGIGEALALECARQQARVVVTGRRLDRLQTLAQSIVESGGQALALQVDVTDEESLRIGISRTIEHFGGLDVVVANAGFGVAGPFDSLTQDDYRRQFETNVFGVLTTLRESLPALKESRGQFVITGSVAGYLSAPGSTPYSMSKFAVRALAEGMRPELRQHGISLTLITPGFVDSEIRLLDNQGRMKDPKDPIPAFLRMPSAVAARQIARAIEKRKPEEIITVHGKILVFLSSHFPGLVRFLLARVRRGKNKAYELS